MMTDEQIAVLKAAALAATPQNIDSAESIDRFEDGSHIECPACGGEGYVPREADFCNYDGTAIGVQFYGIGNEHGAAEAYFRAAKPANVLALIERLERAASLQATTGPMNGIPATLRHGEGAIARCFYCGRYSLDPKTLSDRQPKCECGEKHGWSGSFKKPGPDAKWSGAAPESPQATSIAQIIEELRKDSHDFKNFHRNLCERFGYAHDERDWQRDQLSLIEWIASRVETLMRDAMRYRKLRDADIDAIHKGGVFAGLTPDNVVINGEDLDIAVDLLIDDAAQSAPGDKQ